jgi:phage recombination protein Bet
MTNEKALSNFEKKAVEYVPMGETKAQTLTVAYVRRFLAQKTKNGFEAPDADVIRFMKLCEAQSLNPWAGDAYLLGYDTKDGPQFSMIVGVSAFLKRAEANPNYEGIESGIVVIDVNGSLQNRTGAIDYPGDKLIGGWCRVYRSDREHSSEARVKFSVYDTGRSRWAKDQTGMIEKVARVHALRAAFPTDLGTMYVQEEFNRIVDGSVLDKVEEKPTSMADQALEALKAIEKQTPMQTQNEPAKTQEKKQEQKPAKKTDKKPAKKTNKKPAKKNDEVIKADTVGEVEQFIRDNGGELPEYEFNKAQVRQLLEKASTIERLDQMANELDGKAEPADIDEIVAEFKHNLMAMEDHQ